MNLAWSDSSLFKSWNLNGSSDDSETFTVGSGRSIGNQGASRSVQQSDQMGRWTGHQAKSSAERNEDRMDNDDRRKEEDLEDAANKVVKKKIKRASDKEESKPPPRKASHPVKLAPAAKQDLPPAFSPTCPGSLAPSHPSTMPSSGAATPAVMSSVLCYSHLLDQVAARVHDMTRGPGRPRKLKADAPQAYSSFPPKSSDCVEHYAPHPYDPLRPVMQPLPSIVNHPLDPLSEASSDEEFIFSSPIASSSKRAPQVDVSTTLPDPYPPLYLSPLRRGGHRKMEKERELRREMRRERSMDEVCRAGCLLHHPDIRSGSLARPLEDLYERAIFGQFSQMPFDSPPPPPPPPPPSLAPSTLGHSQRNIDDQGKKLAENLAKCLGEVKLRDPSDDSLLGSILGNALNRLPALVSHNVADAASLVKNESSAIKAALSNLQANLQGSASAGAGRQRESEQRGRDAILQGIASNALSGSKVSSKAIAGIFNVAPSVIRNARDIGNKVVSSCGEGTPVAWGQERPRQPSSNDVSWEDGMYMSDVWQNNGFPSPAKSDQKVYWVAVEGQEAKVLVPKTVVFIYASEDEMYTIYSLTASAEKMRVFSKSTFCDHRPKWVKRFERCNKSVCTCGYCSNAGFVTEAVRVFSHHLLSYMGVEIKPAPPLPGTGSVFWTKDQHVRPDY